MACCHGTASPHTEVTAVSHVDEKRSADISDSMPRRVLQKATRLSASLLWQCQQRFYAQQGPQAWAKTIVPSFITSNAFVAASYARLVLAYLQDSKINQDERVYVVELGCGSGKFGFNFLQAWQRMRGQGHHAIQSIRMVYVMTDYAEANVKACREHPALRPHVESGLLDFAVFDGERDEEFRLSESGVCLSKGQKRYNPMVFLGQYFFDSLKHDAFAVQSSDDSVDVLCEGLLEMGTCAPVLNADAKEESEDCVGSKQLERLAEEISLDQMDNRWIYNPLKSAEYYENPEEKDLNSVLEWYREHLRAAAPVNTPSSRVSFLFPVGAFRCLNQLRGIADNRLLLLTGDKGHTSTEQLYWAGCDDHDPAINSHGSVSLMVNYDAFQRLTETAQGSTLLSSGQSHKLKVCASTFGIEVPTTLQAAFAREDAFGPGDFYELYEATSVPLSFGFPLAADPSLLPFERRPAPQRTTAGQDFLARALSLLRLSNCDADVLYKFRKIFLQHAPAAHPLVQSDVKKAILSACENSFTLNDSRDIWFEAGLIIFNLALSLPDPPFLLEQQLEAKCPSSVAAYRDALRCFQNSERSHGDHYITRCRQGMCLFYLGQHKQSRELIRSSAEESPEDIMAAMWLQKVEEDRSETLQ